MCLVPNPAVAQVPTHIATVRTSTTVPTSTIDDGDLGAWTYFGDWTHAESQVWTDGEHAGTESYSRQAGARAQIQFFGTAAVLSGPTGPNGGRFRVTLDCTTTVDGDAYSASKTPGTALASFADLTPGWHTVVLEVLGTKRAEASHDYVMLDSAETADAAADVDPSKPFAGHAGNDVEDRVWGAATLRRPGCGAASSLLEQLRSRVLNGTFTVPEGGTDFGAVNAHSVRRAHDGVAPGPVTVDGRPVAAATIPLQSRSVQMTVHVPDRPRTLVLTVAADEVVGAPLDVGVGLPDGSFAPTLPLQDGVAGAQRSEAIRVEPGRPVTLVADLRDGSGAGGYSDVTVWSSSSEPAELDVLEGRTTDVSASRYARQLAGVDRPVIVDPEHLAAPADALRHGPVVLSRVLADADQPAWTGDQNSRPGNEVAVPLLFGRSASGEPLRVNGTALPGDTVAVRLPAASGSTSTAHLRFDTSQRCRSLTASVGIDDSTPNRSEATVAVGVFGDGEAIRLSHNGMWPADLEEHPAISGAERSRLIAQLRAAKTAALSALPASDRAAVEAVLAAETAAYAATVDSPAAAAMSYRVPNPVRLGAGATVASGAPAFFTPSWSSTESQGVAAVSGDALFPLSADLVTDRMREQIRTAATGRMLAVRQLPAPLVSRVDLVLTGTPGATVVFAGAGLDCVSIDSAADGTPAPRIAMPRWSQVGVAPLFLPAPRAAGSQALTALSASPLWWDLACPEGPSTRGLSYTATRTRTTSWGWRVVDPHTGYAGDSTAYTAIETSRASRPACAFPADQIREDFSDYRLVSGSHPPDGDQTPLLRETIVDPVAQQFAEVGADWRQRLAHWAERLLVEVMSDEVGWAIWIVLAPLDPIGAFFFNPFTLHALPVEAQIALGAAFVVVQPAMARLLPTGVWDSAVRGGASAGDVLYVATDVARAEAAAGEAGLLDLRGGGELLVPLRSDEQRADLAFERMSQPVVVADGATSRLPVVEGHVPWVEDPSVASIAEGALRCTRSTETQCEPIVLPQPLTGAPGIQPAVAFLVSPPLDNVLVDAAATGYEARYPGSVATAALSDTEAAAPALAATTWMQADAVPVEDAFIALQDASGAVPAGSTVYPVAYSTDVMPLYRFDTRTPSEIFTSGFRLRTKALETYRAGDRTHLNVNVHAAPDVHSGSDAMYVSTTRDPDLPGSRYPGNETLSAHWRYRIGRPSAPGASLRGGGVDVLATVRQEAAGGRPPLPEEIQEYRNVEVTRAEAEVLFPGGIRREAIERADLMQFNPATQRFEVAYSVWNPHFDSRAVYGSTGWRWSSVTASERTGGSVAGSEYHGWTQFDWINANTGVIDLTVLPPSDALYARARETGQTLVFTKAAGEWMLFDEHWGLDYDTLETSGFERGVWASHPDEHVWVPMEQPDDDYLKVNSPGFIWSPPMDMEILPTSP